MTWGRQDAATQLAIDQSSGGTPGIWDVVYLAGQPCPGIAEVNLKLGADLDKRRKKGQKKSKPIDCGAKPAEANVSITLRPSEWDAFSTKFAPLLFALSKSEAQQPISIGHPSLEPWGLDLFTIEDLDQPPPKGGVMKVSFKGVQWVEEPAAISSKQKAINDLASKAAAALSPLLELAGGRESAVKDRVSKLF